MRLAGADIASKLELLSHRSLTDLRNDWRRLYRLSPPKRLSRDLLIRGIAYRLQEQSYGGLSRNILNQLVTRDDQTQIKTEPRSRKPASITLKPGTRLVREWRGQTLSVLVSEDGCFDWNGKRYASLSMIAREVTGAHWSGPRFFGLTNANCNFTTTLHSMSHSDG
ncbi:MAG: DUF2924 domain-containing protein [Methylocystaceae bacterium]|nr:DUF2924 domain-containing protein [Methylocystaceae bacterium]